MELRPELDAYAFMGQKIRCERPVLVDAGARWGIMAQRMVAAAPNATVHAFEPVEANFVKLQACAASDRRIHAHRLILGDEDGAATINVNGSLGTCSVLDAAACLRAYHGDKVETRSRETVRCVTLDGWCAEQSIERIDAIKLDVQGFEVRVLRGAERLLRESVEVVYSEAQLIPLYDGAATFTDIDGYLRSLGFRFHTFTEMFWQERDGQCTCADALWVRERG
jgi:FkbM family methyltransferase